MKSCKYFIYIFKSGNEGTRLKYNCQQVTVETFKYFQIFTKKEINKVNNAPKWELCAKMTKAIVFFGAETPQRIPLCKKLNNLSKISIFLVYLSYKKLKVEIFRPI